MTIKHEVKYLDWTFSFRMSPFSGPLVYDVRFRGERIAYEIGLSEVAVFYSGFAPFMQTQDLADSGALLGTHAKTLVADVDCPASATFVNQVLWTPQTFVNQHSAEPAVYARTFCVFEFPNGYPLRRHSAYGLHQGAFYGGMQDIVLTLRSALTIGNYDYLVDFVFHQNGVIDGRFMSTGYIQSSMYSHNERYGFQISKGVLGNLHQHLAHFKVDLDVGGTDNRYHTLDIRPQEINMTLVSCSFSRKFPDRKYHQSHFEPHLLRDEQEALYQFNFDTPRYHVISNEAKKTDTGLARGYRLTLNGMSKFLQSRDQQNEPLASWARHQLAVTRHKDSELTSSSNYAMFDQLEPTVRFTDFYKDKENIVDQDLVLWLTLGMHHIPHTEDLPVTTTTGTVLSFSLLPYNFFPECPSMSSRDNVFIGHKNRRDPSQGVRVDQFNGPDDQCVSPKSTFLEDLEGDPDIVIQTNKPHLVQ
ncbi:putative amine oxidase [copper-containing] [Aplysia californica]|uniref:Amine oxidase n=1 Tax=Aplysia californica TaxID=6500 RepID=A0ABM1W0C9_APLCA|nr:putative amine oxidase [copper-containing] [Aplysia californica]